MNLFMAKTNIHKFEKVKEFIEEFKIGENDFIFTSKGIYERNFKELGIKATVAYKDTYGNGEPTDIMMDALLKDFNKGKYKRVIAIGGGSVIDMAKILVLKNGKCAEDLFEKKIKLEKVRTLITIPTTCGSGSEVSNVSITEITKLNSKLGLAIDELYPDYAILIPELLVNLPYKFFATSAIDALIHSIESFLSPKANIYTEMFSKQAMEIIIKGFKRIVKEGQDARVLMLDDFLIASNLAGIAFGNAGNGAVHALSSPLSGTYHVSHGEANYQFFTSVFKVYNKKNPNGKIMDLNMILSGLLECEVCNVYDEMEKLLSNIIEKKSLREYGMNEPDILLFTENVIANQQRLLSQSYTELSKEEIKAIYNELL